jgi:HlyD family secretion protein
MVASGTVQREQVKRELARQDGGYKWLVRGIVVVVVLGTIASLVAFWMLNRPPPPARYVLAELSEGDVEETVQSTGTVKPVNEVQVGAQVTGRVTKIFVDFNSQVKAGDVLAEIDPSIFAAQADSTSAQLSAAIASVRRAEANVEANRLRLERTKKLVQEKIGTQAELDSVQGLFDVSSAELVSARAQVNQISAQFKQTQTNLEFTKIISPIDGVVITRSIDNGQTVQANFQAPTLFVLAQDLKKMRVFADIDEADVGRVTEGMPAEINVDAFPSVGFEGKVVQVRLSPVSQQGVVTYAAVIDVENPDLKLRPGMTATVTIKSAIAKGKRRIPNSALRFRPSPPLDEKGKPLPQEPLPKLAPGKGRIWVLVDETRGAEKVEPREVDIGISDGMYTVLLSEPPPEQIVRDETDAAAPKKKGPF